MKIKEITDKETPHLQQELIDQQKHLFELRSQAVTEKLEDPTQIGKTKKDIARIKTVLRQRQIEQGNGAAEKPAEAGKKETSRTRKKARRVVKNTRATAKKTAARKTGATAKKPAVKRKRKPAGEKKAAAKGKKTAKGKKKAAAKKA